MRRYSEGQRYGTAIVGATATTLVAAVLTAWWLEDIAGPWLRGNGLLAFVSAISIIGGVGACWWLTFNGILDWFDRNDPV